MIKDVMIDNQFNSEIDWEYPEASQELQVDKQNNGSDSQVLNPAIKLYNLCVLPR
ncbi:MAG: hypothetical protein WCO49_06895 [Nostocales cyanobacterium ELA608]|jgi:hypothetical protein